MDGFCEFYKGMSMRVAVVSTAWIEMKRSVVQKIAKYKAKKICLACDKPILPGEKVLRGCHSRCTRATYRAIARGAFTDAERVAEGKWLPHGTKGPKPINAVTIEARKIIGD